MADSLDDRPEKRPSAPSGQRGNDGTDGFESRPHRSYTVEEIRQRISTDPKWVERAITALYARQTSDEQVRGTTMQDNGVGFNGTDSVILSSFAQQIQRGRYLSPKQLAVAFKCVPKYAKQLHRIATTKEGS